VTTTLQVPAVVLANVRQRWPNVADAWASHVDAELQSLCDQFRATPRTVLPARYGFVIAAYSPDGQLVLRSSPDPHGAEQSAVAVALAELGTSPAVHHTSTSNHGTWTVLDRVQPGTTLSKADPAAVKIEALFGPLAAMKDQPAPLADMPSIFDWLRTRLDDDRLTDLRPGTTVAPADHRRAAHDLLQRLKG
jgi:streptomycin 6-kinase